MKYETRGVLAWRYRAGQLERVTHTHLVREDEETAACNKKIQMADPYSCSEEASRARPTCPKCAKRYDRAFGATGPVRDFTTKGNRMSRTKASSRDPKYPPYPRGKNKIRKVMTEFESGKLYSSSGKKVTSITQARAIALSEQRAQERKKRPGSRRDFTKSGTCGCSHSPVPTPMRRGRERDFAPVKKAIVPRYRGIKKKIAVFRLKRALKALWEEGKTIPRKAKEALQRAREVAILSGATPAQIQRVEQEVRAFLKEKTQKLYERAYEPRLRRGKPVSAALVRISRDPAFGGTGSTRSARTCPIGTEVQTLVLSQQMFNERQAESWIKRHGFRLTKIDITPNNYRFRQHPPTNFRAGSFRTIRLRPGVEAVIGCPG